MARVRTAKLVPWYHENKDRCEVLTLAETQCVNSASYIATTGKNGSTERTAACKVHADLLLLDEETNWTVKPRKTRKITI